MAEFEDGSEEPETKLINTVYKEYGYITLQMEDGARWPPWENVKFKNPPALGCLFRKKREQEFQKNFVIICPIFIHTQYKL